MTTYPSRPRRPSRKELETALASLDFPLSKEDLVTVVAGGGDDDDAVAHALRALPLGTYDSAAQVLASVEVADQHGA